MPHKRYVPTKDAQERFEGLSKQHKNNLHGLGLGFPDGSPPLEIFTCADCPHVKKCEFAFDAYNTDDECLALK